MCKKPQNKWTVCKKIERMNRIWGEKPRVNKNPGATREKQTLPPTQPFTEDRSTHGPDNSQPRLFIAMVTKNPVMIGFHVSEVER